MDSCCHGWRDSIGVPEVLYSILDVNQSLQVPVVGQLTMDGIPPIPMPERVARVGFWRGFVRLSEGISVFVLGLFGLLVLTHPALRTELLVNPVAAYVHAFHELRNYIPVQYLFG